MRVSRVILAMMMVDWSSPKVRSLDFGLAIGCLVAGVAIGNELSIIGGFGGIVLSLINPMGRMQRFLQGFVRKAKP